MKKRFLSLVLAVFMLCAMLPQIPMEVSAASYDVINVNGVTGEAIVAQARKYLGVPYDTSGGNYWYRTGFGSTMMFDCSGFVYRVCRDVGLASSRQNYTQIPEGQDSHGNYYITAHTQEQRYYGENISAALNKYVTTGDYSDLHPGDLLFLTSDNSSVSHVVIYAGNGKIVHSEGYHGSVVEHPIGRYPTSSNWYFDATRLITCDHNYSNTGVCSKCGVTYNWEYTYNTSCAGIYKVSLSGGVYLRTDKPYSASTAKSELIKSGTEVKVLGSVRNAFEHVWYKISYNGVEGYTSEDNVTWVRENDKQPLATCDEVVGKNGSVYIRGWAFDPDTPSENVAIHVYIDDVLAGAYTANTSRPDVNNAYGCGNNHGFEFTVPCSTGAHSVIVFAVNTTYGENPKGMGPFSVTVSSHTHSYTSKVTKTATCTTTGVRTYTCSGCGASYTESIAATGHSYGSWVTTKKATCTTSGTQQKKCTKCSATQTQNIAAKGHSYGSWVTSTAAGCTTTGTQKKTCSSCGDMQTQSIAATGHNYQSSIIDATCSEYEKIRYTCSKCQHYYEEYTSDKYSDWSTTKPTGIAENLIESKTQYRYRSITHSTEYTSWGSWSSWQDSSVSKTTLRDVETQTLYPYYYYYCKKCGDGTRWYAYGDNCGACGTTMVSSSGTVVWLTTPWSEATPYQPFGTPTGKYAIHVNGLTYWKWTDGSPKTQYRYRTRSSYQTTSYGSWSSWGDTAYSSSSSRDVQTQKVYRYINRQLGEHVWLFSKITTQPTCTAKGVRTYYCNYCDATKTESIAATGEHRWGAWITIAEATCKQEGIQKRECEFCKKTQERRLDIAAHSYNNGICTRCKYKPVGVAITTQPKSVKVGSGKAAAVTVTATGDGLTYQWYYKEKGASKFSLTGSFKGNTYSVSMTSARNGRQVYCVITDAYGNSVKTGTVTLSLNFGITKQPQSMTVIKNKTAKISVSAEGEGLTYQWYYRTKPTKSFKKLSSARSSSYSVKMTSGKNGYQYYCVVKDKYGNTVQSGTATLKVAPTLKITKQPTSTVKVNAGKTAAVTVKASGDGLKYTWYYKDKGSSSYSKSSVATATYTTAMSASVSGRKLYCVVTDQYGQTVKTKTVTLYAKTTVTKQPVSVKVADGKTAKVTVSAAGESLTYKWYVKKPGAKKFSLVKSFQGNSYSCTMSNAYNGCQVYCVVKSKYGGSIRTNTVTLRIG